MSDTPTRDTTMDIKSLISPKTPVQEQTPHEEEKKEMTPVEKMLEQNKNKGIDVSAEEMKKGSDTTVRSTLNSDERLDEYKGALDDLDKKTIASKYLVMKLKPANEIMTAEMMEELDSYDINVLKNLQEKHPEGASLTSKYFNLRSKEDTEALFNLYKITPKKIDNGVDETIARSKEHDKVLEDEGFKKDQNGIYTGKENITTSSVVPEIVEESPVQPVDEERQSLVKVLIDKTNLGIPPIFDQVEADKILMADQVDIVEVEHVDLKSVKTKKPQKSFMEMVNSYNTNGVNIPMTFPCSRFRATMNGLSYGELGDIALNFQEQTYDKFMKKMSIIYNKMRNVSCGKFETFDEFLDGFAYNDVDLATYGLYIGSSSEIDSVQLTCGNDSCGKSFSIDFRPRSLLLFDECGDAFLKNVKRVVDANGEDAKELYESAPHKTEKVYKLPNSGWLVHIAYPTCREFAEYYIKTDFIDEFEKTHQDDVNGVKGLNIIFIQMIRGISVPSEDGYDRFDDRNDIMEALYYMDIKDYEILINMINKFVEDYHYTFGIKKITCPHCGTETALLEVNINDLVFRSYQRRLNTTINLENLEDL
ncbi:MAG TPA: hypothetical protein DCW90_23090 [Lachnospiraceae bacterium]|nr:hypothetical protein [Lachnospiraceae bacterium]